MVIAIARTAPSTTRRSRICPVLIINILVDYLIPIQWSNSQKVAWFVLLTVWQLNVCPEIIATIPREMLTAAFNHPQAGCLQIGAIDLIPEGMGVVPHPIVHLVASFVKHLHHI
jgi:polyferredoxin